MQQPQCYLYAHVSHGLCQVKFVQGSANKDDGAACLAFKTTNNIPDINACHSWRSSKILTDSKTCSLACPRFFCVLCFGPKFVAFTL